MSEINTSYKDQIVEALKGKACAKQKIYKGTLNTFETFKTIALEIISELQEQFDTLDRDIHFEYKSLSIYEFRIKFGGDILVFTMHSNVFGFDDQHGIYNMEYVQNDPLNVYCGMIEVYNFLSDSLTYSRLNDFGYLIGRIFINKEQHFFVEGERQLGFLYNDFTNMEINDIYIRAIIEASILYSIDFDLWAPSFQDMKEISVKDKLIESGFQNRTTAKRLGFKFQSEKQSIGDV